MRRGLSAASLVGGVVLLVVVVGGFVSLTVTIESLRKATRADRQTEQVLALANSLERTVIDLETGLRGYLLTGQQPFLQPYESARAAYPGQSAQLEALVADDPADRARVIAIRNAIDAYVANWTEPLIVSVAPNLAEARARVSSGDGKRRIDAIRAQFRVLDAREQAAADTQRSRAESRGSLAVGIGIGAIAISIALLAFLAGALQRWVVAPLRTLSEAVERRRRGELGARAPAGGRGEVAELIGGFNAMSDELEIRHEESEHQRAELESQQVEIETALAAVEEHNARIEILQRFVERLTDDASLAGLATTALQEIADHAEADVGALYVVGNDDETFELAATRGLAGEEVAPTLVQGRGLAGRALAERRTIAASYASGEALRVPGLSSGRDALHELHLPLLHGDRTIGVVSLGRAHDRAFVPEEQELAETLTQRAAVMCAEALSLRRLEVVARELQTLLDSTDEGIYGIDADGRVTFVNRSALEQTGFDAADLLRQNGHARLHHTRADGTPHPVDECPIYRIFDGGQGLRVPEDVFWRKDGTSFAVEYSAFPLFDGERTTGAVVTFHDVEERKLAKRRLDVQYLVSRVLAERLPVLEALPRALAAVCQTLGWPIGLAWAPGAGPSDLRCAAVHAEPGFAEEAERLASRPGVIGQGPVGRSWRLRRPVAVPEEESIRGALRTVVAVPIVGAGPEPVGVAEFVGAGHEPTTEMLETLEAVAAQVGQFVDRDRAAAESERMKEEFVATVSHELRTPLTAIDGWLHVLLGEEPGELTDDQRRFLTTVKRNSDRLMRLVGDLLLASQLRAGKDIDLDLGDVDMAAAARDTVDLLASLAAEKRIDVALETPPEIVVRGDHARIAQLLTNLLSNAIKFTPEHGHVSVTVAARNGSCRVEVSDTGIGIPSEDRKRLFDRFFRASSATEHGIAGTGLGLAISKAIVEAHNGTIRVLDADGPGTTFGIEIPLAGTKEAP